MTTRSNRARTKLFVSVLTTYGYALVGGGTIGPIITTGEATPIALGALWLGVVLHFWAWYLAPDGETS